MSTAVAFDRALVEKYDQPGPRYTSYPTAPRFRAFDPAGYQRAVDQSLEQAPDRPLSLYVHLPFCRSLCYYCACNKVITHSGERAQHYLSLLEREARLQAALFGRRRTVSQLHLGGGTPTFYDMAALRGLIDTLDQAFALDWSPQREFAIEVDPRTVTGTDLHDLADMGFNRLSFGIQDFDPQVQQAINRVQPLEQVRTLMTAAREAGFASINADLIYGLPCQTPASYDRTLEEIIRLAPDRIAAYSYAHLPDHFRAQRLIRSEDMPTPDTKLGLMQQGIERLTAAGYVYIGMDHFARPDDELATALKDGTLQRNFQGYATRGGSDLVALGASAIGFVGGVYTQNLRDVPDYERRLENGELAVSKGCFPDADDRLRRYVIHALMCQSRVNLADVEHRFGVCFADYFATELEALAPLEADGLLVHDRGAIELRSPGRLLMRSVAMIFDRYLQSAQPQPVRYSRTV